MRSVRSLKEPTKDEKGVLISECTCSKDDLPILPYGLFSAMFVGEFARAADSADNGAWADLRDFAGELAAANDLMEDGLPVRGVSRGRWRGRA